MKGMPVSRPVRTLLFSTLFPSSSRPLHGIFVETRLRELLRMGGVQTRVVAPVPWFPSQDSRFGEYARMAATPQREVRNGIDVFHPRYFLPPKVGMTVAPLMLALCALSALRRIRAEGFDFDLIDAHYYYPDGVAAALLARWLDRPLAITARGTDLNFLPAYAAPRRMMQWAARQADASIGVCGALVDVLRSWDIDPARLHVLRNGVDLQRFRPLERTQARARLRIGGSPLLISVGHLVERKGHHLVIKALAQLLPMYPSAHLVIVGAGQEQYRLEALVRTLGLSDRVKLIGAVPNEELLYWYSAADVAVLASSREGWANVLLEAMACGTPVVATNIWGTPEIVDPSVGVLTDDRSGPALAAAVKQVLTNLPTRAGVRSYAERFGWDETSRGQLSLFHALAFGIERPRK